MEETEEILKKQILSAMENGKKRILLHRTYTGGDKITEEGITRSSCTKGLKVFGDKNIYFSLSDYNNNIDMIMRQIKCAYNYKSSDKVFVVSVPVNALEYTIGNSIPILYETGEKNEFDNKCYVVLPQYVLGYVSVSREGISSLQYNNEIKTDVPTDRHYISSVLSQYREKNDELLQSIRSDKFYTDKEKRNLLKILYANYRQFLSKGLQKSIKHLMPGTDLETRIKTTSLNISKMNEAHRFLNRLLNKNSDRRITKKTIKEEFANPRRITASEIMDAIPNLLDRENEKKSALTIVEMIEEVAKVHGFDRDLMTNLTIPKRTFKDKIKDLFHRKTKQKLLDTMKEQPKVSQEYDEREIFIQELGGNSNQEILPSNMNNNDYRIHVDEGRE